VLRILLLGRVGDVVAYPSCKFLIGPNLLCPKFKNQTLIALKRSHAQPAAHEPTLHLYLNIKVISIGCITYTK
jgi:hypothetical protein